MLGADYPHPSGNLRSLKGWIRSDFISAAWLRLAPFSEAACDFGVRAAAAKRQALIEREPDVGDGFVARWVREELAIACVAFAGVVGRVPR